MDIGLSSACFYPDTLTENTLPKMKEMGFRVAELFLNSPTEYEEKFIDLLGNEANKYNIQINSIHAFCAAFEPFLFEEYERRRDDMFVYFEKMCRSTSQIGAKYYTFHGMRLSRDGNYNKKLIAEVYDKLTYTALKYGIKLCQENVSWCMSSKPDFLEYIKEHSKYPIYFTLDIKQAYKAGLTPIDYLKVMNKNLKNLHINDRDDNSICLLPGHGDVNFQSLKQDLDEVGYNGVGIIEVYRENYKDLSELKRSKEYLEEIFN